MRGVITRINIDWEIIAYNQYTMIVSLSHRLRSCLMRTATFISDGEVREVIDERIIFLIMCLL